MNCGSLFVLGMGGTMGKYRLLLCRRSRIRRNKEQQIRRCLLRLREGTTMREAAV